VEIWNFLGNRDFGVKGGEFGEIVNFGREFLENKDNIGFING
jgi:hypothetical protein